MSTFLYSNNVNKKKIYKMLPDASPPINQLDVLPVFYSKLGHCSDHCFKVSML